jgi:hypothetical protein
MDIPVYDEHKSCLSLEKFCWGFKINEIAVPKA